MSSARLVVGLLVSMDVLEDQAMENELSTQTILHASRTKANALTQGARLSSEKAATARTSGYINAAGLLVQGGSTLYGSGAFDSTPKQTSYATSGPKGSGAGLFV